MAETRQRITRAAYDLHRTVGPAQTTISAIAAQAGVQRHTVYQHFPDEWAVYAACTAYGLDLDPPPDPAVLARILDPEERLRAALTQQYSYYERNESLMANVSRDMPRLEQRLKADGLDIRDLPKVIQSELQQPVRLQASLVPGWPTRMKRPQLKAALALALDFATWRTIVREQGLSQEQAIQLMMNVVVCGGTMRLSVNAKPQRRL
jgi:AcrR family transcriptional regulator